MKKRVAKVGVYLGTPHQPLCINAKALLTSADWGFGGDDTAHSILTAFEHGLLDAHPSNIEEELDSACTRYCESLSAKDGRVPKNARANRDDVLAVRSYISSLRNIGVVSLSFLSHTGCSCAD